MAWISRGLHLALMEVGRMGGVMVTCVDVEGRGRMMRVRRCVLLLLMAVAVVMCGCSKPTGESSRSRVDRVSAASDPDTLELDGAFNAYVRRFIDAESSEIGVIELGNGERVKFWFVSHHISRDKGCTKFVFSDGTVRYLDGAFCCEVQLADEQPKDRAALSAFLDTREGINPAAGG